MTSPAAFMDITSAQWTLDAVDTKPADFVSPHDMRRRIQSLTKLPPLPQIAHRILELNADPFADAEKLAKIIELSPVLSAQLIRWASSALYGYRGKICSVKDAISRVLGFNQVMNLALALAAMSPLDAPREGPLGTRFFWRNALAASFLMQKLAKQLAPDKRPDPGHLHLVGLLRNIGHLLLAHLFRKEFNYLMDLIGANPDISMVQLERFVLNTDHTQLGAWLMQSWEMPEILRIVIQHHHNHGYRGTDECLVWLTWLTDQLLAGMDIGDADKNRPVTEMCERLGFEEDAVRASVSELKDELEKIDDTVISLLQGV